MQVKLNETSIQAPKRSILAIVFLSPNEARLRAGWRLLAQTLAMFIIAILLSPLAFISVLVTGAQWQFLIGQFVEWIVLTASIFLARRFLDRRSIASLGLKLDRQVGKDILAGIGITFVMMGLIYAAMSAAGWLTFEGFAWETESITQVLSGTFTFLALP